MSPVNVSNSTSSNDDVERIGKTVGLVIIVLLSVIGHIIYFVTLFRTPRLRVRTGPWYLFTNIALANVVAVVFSLIPNILATWSGSWTLGDGFCTASAFLTRFTFYQIWHTVGILFVERYVRIMVPLKHKEIFRVIPTMILLSALWFFDAVLSMFPLINWGGYGYLITEGQCAHSVDGYQKNVSHLYFTIVMGIVLPMFLSITLFVVTVRGALRRSKDNEDIFKEELEIPESYGYKLRRREKTLARTIKNPTLTEERMKKLRKRQKKRIKKKNKRAKREDESATHRRYKDAKRKKRACRYRPNEMAFVKTAALILLSISICWIPYLIVKVFETYDIVLPSIIVVIVAFLSYFSHAVCPFIYIISSRSFRRNINRAFCRACLRASKRKKKSEERRQRNVQEGGIIHDNEAYLGDEDSGVEAVSETM
ncbi:probable G-protein coupled receptor No18 [Strongylocentrotus purpuratus]|uniref:G-protein coupled receptors family 1 profile domain-containing protein n=1 Tax=Strongylocentrotus purpuratus TaxID=7668 RepID=A0A7M7HPA3_STRPU|nr:probable G-protein coupled receptor No18 [Strongylocentrotus purpuratus]